jgi:hypothetical protein
MGEPSYWTQRRVLTRRYRIAQELLQRCLARLDVKEARGEKASADEILNVIDLWISFEELRGAVFFGHPTPPEKRAGL